MRVHAAPTHKRTPARYGSDPPALPVGFPPPVATRPPPSELLTSLCSRFAVADTVYRALRTERRDQAVMISGESGAGKTEATKRLLQFYAETCPAPERGGAVRDRLLQSNPVLEVRDQQHLRRKGQGKKACTPLTPFAPRPSEMPRPSGTITPAGLGSTWTCSLTSRYLWGCQGRGWDSHSIGVHQPGPSYQQMFLEHLLYARYYSRCWCYNSETKETKILPSREVDNKQKNVM